VLNCLMIIHFSVIKRNSTLSCHKSIGSSIFVHCMVLVNGDVLILLATMVCSCWEFVANGVFDDYDSDQVDW
jgi:hypothetical protein